MKRLVLCVSASMTVTAPVLAGEKWEIQPVQYGQESLRYVQGVPTVELELNDGVVRMTPLPLDHGRLTFTVAVYNDGAEPANFGIHSIAPRFSALPVRVFTKDELVKQAKNRAFWSQFGIAVLGGAASGLAASQRSYYSSNFVTPRGTYTSLYSAPSIAGQYQAASLAAGTGVSIALVQNQLDRTIAALGDNTVQLTTVDPGESYAGRIVLGRIKPKSLPEEVAFTINWNGEFYPFTFRIVKPGQPAPPFTRIARGSSLTNFRERSAAASTPVAVPISGPRRRVQASTGAQETTPSRSFVNRRIRCITCR